MWVSNRKIYLTMAAVKIKKIKKKQEKKQKYKKWGMIRV